MLGLSADNGRRTGMRLNGGCGDGRKKKRGEPQQIFMLFLMDERSLENMLHVLMAPYVNLGTFHVGPSVRGF
jgi:hypothetical protein